MVINQLMNDVKMAFNFFDGKTLFYVKHPIKPPLVEQKTFSVVAISIALLCSFMDIFRFIHDFCCDYYFQFTILGSSLSIRMSMMLKYFESPAHQSKSKNTMDCHGQRVCTVKSIHTLVVRIRQRLTIHHWIHLYSMKIKLLNCCFEYYFLIEFKFRLLVSSQLTFELFFSFLCV